MALTDTFAELNLVTQSSPRLDLTPRRRIQNAFSSDVGPGIISALPLVVPLTDTLTSNDGLLFDYIAGLIGLTTVATGSDAVTILDVQVGIGPSRPFPTNTILFLQAPQLTFLSLHTATTFTVSVPFISMLDLETLALAGGLPSLFTPGQQPLQLNLSVTLENIDTIVHTFIMSLQSFYRVVHGLEEG